MLKYIDKAFVLFEIFVCISENGKCQWVTQINFSVS